MKEPGISVIVATRNAGRFLAQCLDSVAAQTRPALEVIIVDAASTDDTLAIASRYAGTVILQQDGTGFAAAWNQGIAAARGAYLAFIDSDDRWSPDKLRLQGAMLEADETLAGAIGKVRFFLEPGEVPPPGWRDRILQGEHMGQMPGTLLARRQLFDTLGPWPTDLTIASDIDWFVRLKDAGLPMGVVDALVLEKRVHSDNLSLVTAGQRVYADELIRTLRRSILRKRTQQSASTPRR